MSIPTNLKNKLKSLPATPGVYFHKNASGEIIYVGKAAVLKNRVRQYFHNSPKDPKTTALVAEIADTDWIVVDTEMDALFLESEMIKRYMPKWNILLRDDKTVSYIRIDMKSEIPFVSITRQPLGDNARYIGPFYAKGTIEKALRILRKVFPYYDKPYDGKKTLNTDLGLTPGIEIGKTTPKEYKKNLSKLIRYLEGDRKKLLKDLEKDMKNSAKIGNYEEAALIRDQLFSLQELRKKIVFSDKEFLNISSDQALRDLQSLLNLKTPPRRIEGYDISHISGTNAVASMVVFTNGVSDRSEYRKFKIKESKNDDYANMREVISRRLKHLNTWGRPDLIVLDGSIGQINAVKDLLDAENIPYLGRDKSGNHNKNANVVLVLKAEHIHNRGHAQVATERKRGVPVKTGDANAGQDYVYIPLSGNSHIAKLIARIDEEAHRFAITYHRLLRSKQMTK